MFIYEQNDMNFILNLTFREIRSAWRRLLFFFLCIAIGVGSVVALRSLIINLSKVVGGDARALLTADLVVNSTNDFSPTDVEKIESVIKQSNIVEARNEAMETSAMARPIDKSNETFGFIELKGIEPPFPLVGVFTLSDGAPFDFKLLANNGAVVAPILLEKLNIKVGDKIKIGEGEFQIRATFDEEPGGSNGLRLGSRVFIEKKAFDEAGITRNSGRVRRRILYRTSDNPTELVKDLREAEGKIIELTERRIAAQDQLSRVDIRSPADGIVDQMTVFTVGGVINTAEPLMMIVPQDDRLVVEAKIAPHDIDQARSHKKAVIRFPAFNQRTTPSLDGTVESISAELTKEQQTNMQYYVARIKIDEMEMKRLGTLQLVPGMPAEIQIRTTERSALSYLLKPLEDAFAKSFKER